MTSAGTSTALAMLLILPVSACQLADTPRSEVPAPSSDPSPAPASDPPPSGISPTSSPDLPRRVIAVGDMASENDRDDRVAAMIASRDPDALLALGDLVYPDGTIENYEAFYATSYGRFDGIVWPVPGNHDYRDGDLSGYLEYFSSRAPHVPADPYYSFELGGWRMFALNSEIGQGQAGTAQYRWLERQLQGRENECVAAYWHSPVFTIGRKEFDEDRMHDLLRLLMRHDVDLVLTGHDHNYQHWLLDGLDYFIVGLGGRSRYDLERSDDRVVFATDEVNGAIEFAFGPDGAEFGFQTVDGETLDEGVISC